MLAWRLLLLSRGRRAGDCQTAVAHTVITLKQCKKEQTKKKTLWETGFAKSAVESISVNRVRTAPQNFRHIGYPKTACAHQLVQNGD